MKTHVLDANALHRFLTDGPGADVVRRLLKQARDAEQPLQMSVVNWGEVYYTVAKTQGFAATDRIMDRVRMLPLTLLPADELATTRAAKLKASYGLPYADCFAAAAAGTGGVIVTADVKDFRKVPGVQLLALPEHKPGRNPS
jgi:predicted nucleic acid-binding protein